MHWTTQANRDLRAALAYYGEQSPDSAQKFLDQLGGITQRIESMPGSGHPNLNNTRRTLMNRLPYGVVYRISLGEPVIVAIPHGSRRPGYWIRRD
ncbi:MAG TPA: type II toxin-antitoxin system RelE/ParE family toxin [Tepidiformaceae bacterium]|nr:type II toxin-antitoxin system RelE/ParE family toxin [Tepidiformaceae bacterium]